MSRNDVIKYRNIPPYLHLLKPIDLENKREEAKRGAGKAIQYRCVHKARGSGEVNRETAQAMLCV